MPRWSVRRRALRVPYAAEQQVVHDVTLVQALALEAGQRPELGTRRVAAVGLGVLELRVRGRARRASARRTAPSRSRSARARRAQPVARPGRGTPAGSAAACGAASWATGRGSRRAGRRGSRGSSISRSRMIASPLATRTLVSPCRSARPSRLPWPGVCTSTARMPVPGSSAAICAVASPMPKPISRTTGRPSPNRSARSRTRARRCPGPTWATAAGARPPGRR